MPLLFAPENKMMRIVKVRGDAAYVKHLSDLGILPGGEILVMRAVSGSAICMVKGTRVGLDHATSMSVEVVPA